MRRSGYDRISEFVAVCVGRAKSDRLGRIFVGRYRLVACDRNSVQSCYNDRYDLAVGLFRGRGSKCNFVASRLIERRRPNKFTGRRIQLCSAGQTDGAVNYCVSVAVSRLNCERQR